MHSRLIGNSGNDAYTTTTVHHTPPMMECAHDIEENRMRKEGLIEET